MQNPEPRQLHCHERCPKNISAQPYLSGVPAAVHVAEKMGEKLGTGEILQRQMPDE
jgi:hypothetical protein